MFYIHFYFSFFLFFFPFEGELSSFMYIFFLLIKFFFSLKIIIEKKEMSKLPSFFFFFLWKVQLISTKWCSCAFLVSKNVDVIYHRVGICMTVYNSSQWHLSFLEILSSFSRDAWKPALLTCKLQNMMERNKRWKHVSVLTMKTLPCFPSHKYNITTSKEHRNWLIFSGLPSKKKNGFAAQTWERTPYR